MKILLSESQLSHIIQSVKGLVNLNERINLNLSKQIRLYQTKKGADKQLADVFGENVYRLYYDLDTGKQIYPTRKQPKLDMDIFPKNELENELSSLLSKLGYTILSFEDNVAINDKTKQKIKISKAISDYDVSLLKKYALYLDANIKGYKGDEKLYCVVSRHAHDIAGMSAHDNLSSCEDLRDYTDIKQTNIIKGADYAIGDGHGLRINGMINEGYVIFYLIKDGDWNIQNPVARFASGIYCENGEGYYGNANDKFKNFVRTWLPKFNVEKMGRGTLMDDNFYKTELKYELYKTLRHNYNTESGFNKVLYGIIKNNRYDVIQEYVDVNGMDEIGRLVYGTLKSFGANYYKTMLDEKIKKIFDIWINKTLGDIIHRINRTYDAVFNYDKISTYNKMFMNKKVALDDDTIDYLILYLENIKNQYFGFNTFNIANNLELNLAESLKLLCPINPDKCNLAKVKWKKIVDHCNGDLATYRKIVINNVDNDIEKIKKQNKIN